MAPAAIGAIAMKALPWVLQALPLIMAAVAAKHGGPALGNAAANALNNKAASNIPAGARILNNGFYQPRIAGRFGAKVPIPTSKLAPLLSGGGNWIGMAGATALSALPIIMQLVANSAGKATQAAGVAGGATAQAAANIPAHLASIGRSDMQRHVYGGSPSDALGGIASDVGTAAGVGVSAAGNAVGSSLQDVGNTLGLYNVSNRLFGNMDQLAQRIKSYGLPASAQGTLQRAITAAGHRP